ncbi:MAG: hypothetical protein PHY77_06535 [Desulfotomaculaceae bacterium]|nr:hypothetical protein [Desulfotomaculaceae bacterium]
MNSKNKGQARFIIKKNTAIVIERTDLQGIAKQNPDPAVIEEPVQFVDVAVAVKKNNPLLLNAVN